MPSDANGVYSLPSGYEAVTGETIQASQHNPPLEDIETAITGRLMRSGAAPMTGPLKAVDGSVGSPAVQFANGATTGWYKTTNGIGISINGTKVAEFTASGMVSGSRFLGELIPFAGLTAPALTVLPYGQTLSRTTYADLWTFAQTEIAAGNTFYNNGNGSTTFGIGDMRGRVPAGKDDMGGVAAARLTSTYFGSSAAALGAVGGSESHTLTTAQLAAHSHANSLNDPTHTHAISVNNAVSGSTTTGGGGFPAGNSTAATIAFAAALTGMTITNVNAGGGGAHNNVQPTIICNYLLFAGA